MKTSTFVEIESDAAKIQLYIGKSTLENIEYELLEQFDLGDIIFVSGVLFYTRTQELTLEVSQLVLLVKSQYPLPEKHKGLVDIESRYRHRYLDLIVNTDAHRIFRSRAAVIDSFRESLKAEHYLEVETPMMHPILGGAAARPFKTKHNALDIPLFMRVAPELYLKKLLVGGMERVFEINRNFRNEGVSTRHNPEFTMLEFYQAYEVVEGQMLRTEKLIRNAAELFLDIYKDKTEHICKLLDDDFLRLDMMQAVCEKLDLNESVFEDTAMSLELASKHAIDVKIYKDPGYILNELFEKYIEPELSRPTFVTGHPKSISPLSRRSENDALRTERFELYVAGMEIANGFSELNDPTEQRKIFDMQVENSKLGDPEAMPEIDEDYLLALEYGLPPCSGVGIGIDRVCMAFLQVQSIREVLLYPLLKPK